MPEATRVTTGAIAGRLGLSQSTVAHILNETPGMKFSEKTRNRVREAAAAMGYQQARLSQAMKRPLRHIGVVFGRSDYTANGFLMRLVDGVTRTAIEANYFPSIQILPEKTDAEGTERAFKRILELYQGRLVDGFLIDKPGVYNATVGRLAEYDVPLVTVNGQAVEGANAPIPAVNTDNFTGGRLATEHLLGLGHRKIGLITIWQSAAFQLSRLVEGYEAALRAAGIAPDGEWVRESSPWDRSRVEATVAGLFSAAAPPTALLVADEAMAILVIQTLQSRGLRVPDDVSVMGYGNWQPSMRFAFPALTTMDTQIDTNAQVATEILISLIERRDPGPTQRFIEPTVINGASTGPATA